MRSTGPSVSEKRIDALPKIKREGEETAMSEFLSANLPYLLSGISVGGQYALIAIGYTMVYGILRLINFAHGDVFMVAGLVMVYATASLPIYVSIVLVVVVTVAIGVIIEKVAYKPLRSAPRMSVMISAIGVSYLLQNCALYFTGGLPQIYPTIPFLSEQVQIRFRHHQDGYYHHTNSDHCSGAAAGADDQADQDGNGHAGGLQGL